jgi:hypothetical protein
MVLANVRVVLWRAKERDAGLAEKRRAQEKAIEAGEQKSESRAGHPRE